MIEIYVTFWDLKVLISYRNRHSKGYFIKTTKSEHEGKTTEPRYRWSKNFAPSKKRTLVNVVVQFEPLGCLKWMNNICFFDVDENGFWYYFFTEVYHD